MPLRFRSLVPYTVPGVLVLIGWWWYTSRKKGRIGANEEPAASAVALRSSPSEGTNGMLEMTCPTSPHSRSSRDRNRAKVEQQVQAEVHVSDPVLKALPVPVQLMTVEEGEASTGPEEAQATCSKSPLLEDQAPVVMVTKSDSGEGLQQSVVEVTPNAKLSHFVRPEPEGEVAAVDKTTTPFNETVPVEQTHGIVAAAEEESKGLQENGFSSVESEGEIERLAAGLITGVITAATREVLSTAAQSQPDSHVEDGGGDAGEMLAPSCSSTPVPNGRTCAVRDQSARTGGPTPADVQHTEGSSQGEVNGCLGADDSGNASMRTSPNVPKRAEESHRSASQSEDDGVHSMTETAVAALAQLHNQTACAEAEPVCEEKSVNGVELRNGTAGAVCDTDADQSGGSDVNSMDSMDSGCTLGAGEGKSAGGQTGPLSRSEMVVWEIEVPKHLVGRLIGKQGRYVSFLKQSSGARIYVSTLPYTQDFQMCHIEGTQTQVDKALALIGKKFKDLDLTNLYAPAPLPLTLPSLPMTSWLLLPNGVTVEVIVVNIVSAGHVFVQQHTHPTYHALRSLDQQMFLCYSQPGTPSLPTPVEVGVICAAPAVEGAWWRAQVISYYKDSCEVEIRYVDYGGYNRVKVDTLRQIRSDFVTLPFQGAEVLLDNLAPLPGTECFSTEANSALEEMTRGVPLLAQVTNYDNNTGLPLVQIWNMVGDELVSVNRTLAEQGFGSWVDSF